MVNGCTVDDFQRLAGGTIVRQVINEGFELMIQARRRVYRNKRVTRRRCPINAQQAEGPASTVGTQEKNEWADGGGYYMTTAI